MASVPMFSFDTAERILSGIEALHMMREWQVKGLGRNDGVGQGKFVMSLFDVAI